MSYSTRTLNLSEIKREFDNNPSFKKLLMGDTTDQSSVIPNLTTTQRNAITSPQEGLLIYNVTTHKLNIRTAAAWEVVTSA